MTDIRIYQIDLDRDNDGVAFEPYGTLARYQGSPDVNPALYDKVFDGAVNASDIEDIYRIFNAEKPEGYEGRSLSVSDVVEIVKSDDIKPGFYYCDSIGFKPVPFDAEHAKEPESEKITVVMLEPGKVARTAEIGTSLADLQKAVGGMIEAYYPFEEEVCIVCNDEGKFNGMSPCRAVYDPEGRMMDIIFGPCFICDCRGENFGSRSQDQIRRYTEQFRNPEHYFRIGGVIRAEPYEPKVHDLSR